jgi:hypothetical protein
MDAMQSSRRLLLQSDDIWEALREDAAWALGSRTKETACLELHLDGATLRGQVRQPTPVAAVDMLRRLSAVRTSRGCRDGSHDEDGGLRFDDNLFELQGRK